MKAANGGWLYLWIGVFHSKQAEKEATWLTNFIGDLGFVPSIQEPMEIFYDNKGVVGLTKEPKDHGPSRHIKRKYHYIWYQVEEGKLIVNHVWSEENHVDPFTKCLRNIKNFEQARSVGLSDDITF